MLEPAIDKTDLPTSSAEPSFRATETTTASGALSRKFVEMLLEDAGKLPISSAPSKKGGTRTVFDDFGLDDAPDGKDDPALTLSVDDAAVAVLLAAAFEKDPSTLRGLRRETPVVVVQAPDTRTLLSLEYVMRVCALGRSTGILSNGTLDSLSHAGLPTYERRQAVILTCDVDKRGRQDLEQRALMALSLALPTCALSTDVGRNVPEQLRAVADRIVLLGGWNASLLSVLIEAVTGAGTTVPDETWIASTTLDDLRMSVSKHRGVTGSLDRLRSTVRRRLSKGTDLPDVSELYGYGEAKRIAGEMLTDLSAYRDGKVAWSAMSRGLVLVGPTGVGKSFFARCFAKSAKLPIVIGSMAQWQASGDGHLGDCLKAMKQTFADARNSAPSILFIDEIDSVGDRATFHSRHRDYSSQVVNSLLEELDGAVERVGVTVLAATNHIDRIDSAILRPGRLDRVVTIDLPDVRELAGILRTQLGPDLSDVDLLPVALAGRGGSGASVASWVRQARGSARRDGRELTIEDLLVAVRDGRFVVPEHDRRRIAVHEAAHACAAIALDVGSVQGVSLHDAGGTTHMKPAVRTMTRVEAIAAIVHLLAGRAAERRMIGSVSAGAGGSPSSDLALATRGALGVEASWGLGDGGPVWFGEVGNDFSTLALVPGLMISVRRLLRHCEAEADKFVAANAEPISRCADRLLESGYLDAGEVLDALGTVIRFVPAVEIDVPDAAMPVGRRGD